MQGVHDMRQAAGGDELALVMLHGFPLDWRMYQALAQAAPDLPLIAIDLPGAGQTPVPDAAPDLAFSAQHVAAALAGLGVTRCVLAGLSMGGYVAMRVAQLFPDLVAGLGLLDTKAEADDDAARAGRLATATQVEQQTSVAPVAGMATTLLGQSNRVSRPDLVEMMRGWIAEQKPAYVAWSQRAMAVRPDSFGVLKAFTGPAAVLVGQEDQVAPVDRAQAMAAALPDASLGVIPGAGHMSALEQPAAVAHELRELLRRVNVQELRAQ